MIPFPEPADQATVRIDPGWSGRHMELLDRAQKGGIDLYLLGDSLTDYWGWPEFNSSFDKYFSGWKTGNFGIGGDRTEHVLWRIKNGELDSVKPKVIVLLIGTNNLPRLQHNYPASTPEATAAGVRAILDVIKVKQPQAKLLLVSVLPRDATGEAEGHINDKIKMLNAMVSRFADGQQIRYLDIFDQFLDKNGHLKPALFDPDRLHLAAPGYDVWGQAMKPILTQWLGEAEKT